MTGLAIAGTIAGITSNAIAAKRAKDEAANQQEIKDTQQAALDALVEERPVFKNPYLLF